MNLLDTILEYNQEFVRNGRYAPYLSDKLPKKKYVVITCMDTRLVELLPASMDIHNGDVILLKTGGAIISHAFGSVMRSVLVGVYELGAKEIFIVGHHDCGMGKVNSSVMIEKIKENGIKEETLKTIGSSGIDLQSWLRGFDSVEETIKNGVRIVRNHPLLANVPVHGLIMDPDTGGIDVVEAGYEAVLSK